MNNLKKTLLALATTTAIVAMPSVSTAQDIKVGHLTYHTGEFGGFGSFFDGVTDFALSVINEDPPLGRTMVPIHQDIGTIGEARAARKLIDSENIDVLLNAAHNYMSYRDYVLGKIESDNGLLLPSVHGGAIEAEFGGNGAEPLFRGSPMDSAQGVAALLHVKNSGAESIVIVATEAAGSQLQKDAGIRAAEKLGLEVLDTIDVQPEQPNYRSVVSRIAGLNADAVVMFSSPTAGGTFVKNAAEAGNSWFIVGSQEWQEPGFIETATVGAASQHQGVVLAAYANTEGEAWDFYKSAAEGSPQAEIIGDVGNSYAIQYYDLLVATALAIEKSGGTNSDAWTQAMYEVTEGDGEPVYTYADGIAALREGKEINYDGVTGTVEYTDTGVVAGIFGIYRWADGETLERVALADGNEVLALDQ